MGQLTTLTTKRCDEVGSKHSYKIMAGNDLSIGLTYVKFGCVNCRDAVYLTRGVIYGLLCNHITWQDVIDSGFILRPVEYYTINYPDNVRSMVQFRQSRGLSRL